MAANACYVTCAVDNWEM